MTIQILNDFHGDGIFRDDSGAIWVRQSELVESMARAWDEGADAQFYTPDHLTNDREHNPYRTEQS